MRPKPTRGVEAARSRATAGHATRWASRGIAFAVMLGASTASASPAIDGTRTLSMGNSGRASSASTDAALINASAMNFAQTLTVGALYQYNVRERIHGIGAVAMDSLNNARISVGLGYIFMKSAPRVSYFDVALGARRELELSGFGHEVFVALSVLAVKNWLALGVTPKYQYNSLRYLDVNGVARDATRRLNAFGLDASATLNLLGWASVAVTGTNLVGSYASPYSDERELNLSGLPVQPGTISHGELGPTSAYPLTVTHSAAIYPLHGPTFSLNFDGVYDFTSYKDEDYTRIMLGGSAEFVAGPVPIRAGSFWDRRGPGDDDDRIYVSAGLGFVKPAKIGSVGVDVGAGFRQQVGRPVKETVFGLHLGIRLHPDI